MKQGKHLGKRNHDHDGKSSKADQARTTTLEPLLRINYFTGFLKMKYKAADIERVKSNELFDLFLFNNGVALAVAMLP